MYELKFEKKKLNLKVVIIDLPFIISKKFAIYD